MMTEKKNTTMRYGRLVGTVIILLLWLIVNLRVAAGVASPLERTLDGLVGGLVLLVAIFWAISFFGLAPRKQRPPGS